MINRNCKKCGIEFCTTYGKKVFCNKVCRKRFNSTKDITKQAKNKLYHLWKSKHPELSKMTSTCSVCNEKFNKKSGKQRCCSEQCSTVWRNTRHFLTLYGIDVKDYNVLLEKQQGKCLLCNKIEKLHVDHSHISGEVRGLLCIVCNTRLGTLEKILSDRVWFGLALNHLKTKI